MRILTSIPQITFRNWFSNLIAKLFLLKPISLFSKASNKRKIRNLITTPRRESMLTTTKNSNSDTKFQRVKSSDNFSELSSLDWTRDFYISIGKYSSGNEFRYKLRRQSCKLVEQVVNKHGQRKLRWTSRSFRTRYINIERSPIVGLVSRFLTSTKRHIVDSNSIRTIVCQLYNVGSDETARGIQEITSGDTGPETRKKKKKPGIEFALLDTRNQYRSHCSRPVLSSCFVKIDSLDD